MKKERFQYWKKNLLIVACLLAVWAFVAFGCSIFFVEQLNSINIGGFPLGFWFAQQGGIYIFVILIFVYFFIMEKVDRDFDVDE